LRCRIEQARLLDGNIGGVTDILIERMHNFRFLMILKANDPHLKSWVETPKDQIFHPELPFGIFKTRYLIL